MNKGNKIHLGCGKKYLKGWINVDCDKRVKADVYADVNDGLPFEDDSAEIIYSRFFVEHLHIPMAKFLDECYRVLKRRGTLRIITVNSFRWENRMRYLFGRFHMGSDVIIQHSMILKPYDLSLLLHHTKFGRIDFKDTTSFWSRFGLEQAFPNWFARHIDVNAMKIV